MNWWQYLLLANVYLILFYSFYAVMLSRETFFQLNRVYLVSSAVLSFLIPVIQAEWVRGLFITQRINQTLYHLDMTAVYNVQVPLRQDSGITLGQGLAVIYLGGIVYLLVRFLVQMALLRRSLRKPTGTEAYSFFKNIKLSSTLANRDVIMAHEQVHARQWHSADVLLIEALMIINWFNPVVYFYRKAIKHIHEFIADRDALSAGTGKREYALLLLSETFKTPANNLVNSFFNHSLLKQRIIMLNKNHSRRNALIKYGLSAPLFAIMLVLSSATAKTNKIINTINAKVTDVMLFPAPGTNGATASAASKPSLYLVTSLGPQPKPNGKIYKTVERSAEFPGGLKAFSKFLAKNIRMTPEIKREIPDAPVIVKFIVEPDGSLTGLTVLKGTGAPALEAVRVLSMSPRWKPGMHNNIKVRQEYTLPIRFTVEGQQVGAAMNKNDDNALFTEVEESAEFPGGLNAFGEFLARNIHVTPEIKAKMPFPKVICQFNVEENGELSNIRILRGSDVPAADNEALRVLAMSPKWKPGIQNGRTVRQQYTVPISFALEAMQKTGKINSGFGNMGVPKTAVFDTSKNQTVMVTTKKRNVNQAVYFINGKQVYNGLNGLSPDNIKSISVMQSKFKDAEGARDTVRIQLKADSHQ